MKKLIDFILALVINIFMFLIWLYISLISSGVPIYINNTQFYSNIILLTLLFIINFIYLKKFTLFNKINRLFSFINLILWFIALNNTLLIEAPTIASERIAKLNFLGLAITIISIFISYTNKKTNKPVKVVKKSINYNNQKN